jgi:hypothetical protein
MRMDLNYLVMLIFGVWFDSKIKRLTKDYKTVEEARKGFHARIKSSKYHWIPGDIRKRAEQWVDRMCDRSKTVEELAVNMRASLDDALADVTDVLH